MSEHMNDGVALRYGPSTGSVPTQDDRKEDAGDDPPSREASAGEAAEDPSLSLSRKGRDGTDASAFADAELSGSIAPGNNRRMQVRRSEGRRLFDAELKEAFLERLSCTANVAASGAMVGISEGCVYSHRRADPEFREQFWIALEQGTAKLAALRLQRNPQIARL